MTRIFTLSFLIVFALAARVSAQCTYPSGTYIKKGTTFQGSFNSGTSSDPDVVCTGNKIIYELNPPTGYTNAQFGTTWVITALTFKTANGTNAKDTTLLLPSASNGNGKLIFTPRASFGDSTFILIASIKTFTSTCDTILTRYTYVAPRPSVSFLPSSNLICLGDIISFSNTTPGSSLTYYWDFGDGSISTSKSPNYTYTSAGTYKVWLKVTNSNGCTDSSYETVVVTPYPKANFSLSASNACLGKSVTFTNTSTNTSLASYEYHFGDDSIASTPNATHTYTSAGTYNVWLIVTNGAGCQDSIKRQVTVTAPPTVGFSGTDVCLGSPTAFTNTSSSGAGITYLWKFDDAGTSTDQAPVHTFTKTGAHRVALYVSATGGCTDSLVDTVNVFGITAGFAAGNVCVGTPTPFIDQSSVAGGSISSRVWKFGDGDTSHAQNPTHTYALAGLYNVTLVITSSNSCTDSISKMVLVHELPTATFTHSETNLDASFTPDDAALTTYRWYFGDGDSANVKTPTHSYDSAGTYNVTLRVVNSNGCVSEASDSVTVTKPNGIAENNATTFPVSVFPNPFADETTVRYELKRSASVTISMYDVNGRLVFSREAGKQSSGQHAIVLKENIPSGVYLIRLVADNAVVTKQIVRIER